MAGGGIRNIFKSNTVNSLDKNFVIGMGLATIVVITLWWTPLLFPFRMMTTTVHELSHAITVILTGGTVQGFDVNVNGSGVVYFAGGFSLLVYSAGYLGSTIFGGVMLLVAKNAKGRRNALLFMAIGIVVVLLVAGLLRAIRNGNPFDIIIFRDFWALAIVIMLVGLLWLVAFKAPDVVSAFICYTLALLSVLYALFDLLNVFTSSFNTWGGFNDARGLESATHIPAFIWAGVWCAVAGVILWQFFRAALRGGGSSEKSLPGKGSMKSPLDKYNDKFNF
jgi:hypothetical protein